MGNSLNTTLAYSYLQLRLEGKLEKDDGYFEDIHTVCDLLGITPCNSWLELLTHRIGFTIEEAVWLSDSRTKQQITEFYANLYKGIRG